MGTILLVDDRDMDGRGECASLDRGGAARPVASAAVTDSMSWAQSIVLGAVQGLTEFLPVSSSGHLRIVSEVWFGDDAGASFTAVTQLGTEAAVLVYFARDIVRIIAAWFRGLRRPEARDLDYRIGWYVIIATIPIGVLGFLFKDQIRTGARNLWLIATMLIVFSLVIFLAERYGAKKRPIEQLTRRDGLVMGFAQCLALIPGVSRSGATSSAGLFLGLEREAAVRFSFLLAIPAVTASGLFSLPDAFSPSGDGMQASGPQLLVATLVAFVIGFASIAWLLKFVANHSLNWFVAYRIILGLVVMGLLAGGAISAT
ncbi:undecaprenyl-diphosphatase [Williamsia muralis]|uniref:Undecaprenyl-diphosphatase n=1 Tax=Williamsia marianensis TaxID=85044 RepID=A0A315SMU5_WILMA|nr:undecaprenyl-diphosphatase [Williamsia marianensis]RKR95523.1 undecaprenyl-diphosphatase [Williamsia muralis]